MHISIIIAVCGYFLASIGAIVANPPGEQTSLYNFASLAGGITEIDPIITGVRVSKNQLARWEAAKERYEICGLCGEGQAFPGDQPN